MQRRFANLGCCFLATLAFVAFTSADQPAPTPQPAAQVQAVPNSAYDRPFKTPEMTALARDARPFEYKDVGKQIPNYRGGKGATLNLQQQPVRPEESMKHMVVPKGFHVEFVVGDPD